MTAVTLRQIVEQSLAEIGVDSKVACKPKGKMRTTTWLAGGSGLGVRHYASGRHVYIVQPRIGWRCRTITIGPASVLTQYQAMMVARRVVAHAQVGHDPATTRLRIRSAPSMDDFMKEYWENARNPGSSRPEPLPPTIGGRISMEPSPISTLIV